MSLDALVSTPTVPPDVTRVLAITAGSQTPDPDRTIRISQAKTYPNQVWFFLASFIFLVSTIRLINRLYGFYLSRHIRLHPTPPRNTVEGEANSTRGKINLMRLPIALVDTFRAISFRWTIRIGRSYILNFAEVFLTALYIVICLTWSLVNTTSTKGVKFDPKYYANTAGNIASAQLPLITALGMKNNVISYLTGVSFDKLIYLHGMTSRVLVVLIWLHAAGRADLGMTGKVAISIPDIQVGLLSGIAITLLAAVSIRPIRDRAYEYFLVVHFILAFITVLGAYFHAASLGFGNYIWPSFLLWALDRVIRIIRTLIFSFSSKSKSNNSTSQPFSITIKKAQINILSPNFLTLTIPSSTHFHWLPGQSVYLSFPTISPIFYPFEAHPFTIATIDTSNSTSTSTSTSTEIKDIIKTPTTKQLKFFLRIRSGLTNRLFQKADSNELKVLIDGPYSSPPILEGYNSIVLIAGGSGIAFTLPLFLDLLAKSKKQGLACRRILFVWAIRSTEHISWIQLELLTAISNVPQDLNIKIHIFVTGNTPESDPEQFETISEDKDKESTNDDSQSDEKQSNLEEGPSSSSPIVGGGGTSNDKNNDNHGDIIDHPLVKIHQTRADLDSLIKDEIRNTRGTMSVNVCGTHALAEATRRAIRYPRIRDILRGGPSVSLHVEAFGNA